MNKAERRYRWLARFWAYCFIVAGSLFAAAPERVAAFLRWEGELLGLGGTLEFGRGSLAWALCLSLMATLVLLAFQSAARPREAGPYRAMMLSKLTSTVVFLWLGSQQGPVWVLAAGADFFVAVTLFAARLPVPNAGPVGGFADRYLRWMGVDEEGRAHHARMLAGAPTEVRMAIRTANLFFTYLAPLLLTGRPRTARSLDDEAMERLVERIRATPSPAVRMFWIMVHQPACGALARARCISPSRATGAADTSPQGTRVPVAPAGAPAVPAEGAV